MGTDEAVRATYRLEVSPEAAEARVRALILEQTAELPDAAVGDPALRATILGRLESLHREDDAVHHATIAWPEALFDGSVATLLTVLFGNSSLRGDARLVHLDVPAATRRELGGPRHGIDGLREACGAIGRPLTWTALKPVGFSVERLAALAGTFAGAGIDVVKDDHGLADQATAPFEPRVAACAAAVRDARERTGRPTVYCPSVTGGPDLLRRRIDFAREAGAGAVMLQPAVIGLPVLSDLVRAEIGMPVLAHPALAGGSGLAPEALLGRLFRLLGADAVVFPDYGGRFAWSDRTCARVAHGLRSTWDPLAASLPVPAGGTSVERVEEMIRFYGRDVGLLIGGDLYLAGADLEGRTREFVGEVARAGEPR